MENFKYKKYKNKLTLTQYLGDEEIIKIPEKINGMDVCKIDFMCFFNLDNIREIHFPENIVISNNVIVGCDMLEKVYIKNTKKIGRFIEDCPNAKIVVNNVKDSKKIKKLKIENDIIDLSIFSTKENLDGSLHIYGINIGKNLEEANIIIPDFIDGKAITSLGKSLFSNLNINSVTINNFITTIPESCFYNSTINNLYNIENIIEIKEYAFSGSNVKNPLFFKNIETIENVAFTYFRGEVSFGKKIRKIGKKAFSYSNIFMMDLSEFKGELASNLFENCTELTILLLNKKIKSIPDFFVTNCYKLKEINGLKNVESIGSYSFSNCSDLLYNDISFKKLKYIGERAFFKCNLTKTIRIANCELADNSFNHCLGVKNIIFDENFKKESIPNYCFASSSIEKVILNENIKEIKNGAFSDCEHLTHINLENIEVIGDYAFRHSPLLKITSLGNRLTKIGAEVFRGNKKLRKISFKDTQVIEIPKYCFYGCTNLQEILLRDEIESIEYCAFAHVGIKELQLPKKLKKIGQSFLLNTKIKYLEIPENVKFLESRTFNGVNNKLRLVFKSNDITFKSYAFSDIKLVELDLSNITNLKTISDGLFQGAQITSLKLPKGIQTIDYSAFNNAIIKNLTMDTSDILTIGLYAFYRATIHNFDIITTAKYYKEGCYYYYNCNNTKSKDYYFKNVEEIGKNAFYETPIKSLTIEGEPILERENFERCGVEKITATKKITRKLKSRSFFKYDSRSVKIESI